MPLYHFTKLSTFLDYILPSGKLRSNSLANMNDPRESHGWSFGSINLPLEKIFSGYYSDKTHNDCLSKIGRMIQDRFQVVCFSGANQRGWNNEMMWAHYADRQSGLCLEFDEQLLSAALEKNFPSIRYELKDVNYEKKSTEKPWINWDVRVSNDENISNFLEVLSKRVTFNKSHFWEKEDEKRLLLLNHSQPVYLPFENALKAIHIGLGIPKPLHDGIYNAINGTGIKLYVMVYQNDRYERWDLSKKEMEWYTSEAEVGY